MKYITDGVNDNGTDSWDDLFILTLKTSDTSNKVR